MLKRVARVVTRAVAVVILVPPLAPTTSATCPSGRTRTEGLMLDNGRFPGLMKLAGDGDTPKSLVMLGNEKSSIWSLRIIPVEGDIISDPNTRLMVLVTATAVPSVNIDSRMLR